MSEYIVELNAKLYTDLRFKRREEIVRCRDCVHYYEAEEYHPQGNYDKRCCKYFDTYDDEVESDGFCAWGERK